MSNKMEEGAIGIIKAFTHDLRGILDMMDGVDIETIAEILASTHDRYAVMVGIDPIAVDVAPSDEPEDEYGEKSYKKKKHRFGDAVEDPSREQRSNLPPAAFEPSAFFANEEGEYDPDGSFLVSKSKLPHHIREVEDPDGNETVDVPRLRNALARFTQVDWSGFPEGTARKARAHLERHADAILKGREQEGGTCRSCTKEDLDDLESALRQLRSGLRNA